MKSSNTGYNQEKFYVFNTTQFSYTVQISGTFAFGYGVGVSSPHHEYLVEKLEKLQKKSYKINYFQQTFKIRRTITLFKLYPH